MSKINQHKEEVLKEFDEKSKVLRIEGGLMTTGGRLGEENVKSFISSALDRHKEIVEGEVKAVISKMEKPDLNLEPGFNITAEYRLGEIRGYNQALKEILEVIHKSR